MKNKIFILLLALFLPVILNAQCNENIDKDTKEVNYYIQTEEKEDIPMTIHIVGLTENIYITVYENLNETTTTYKYSDTINGEITIDHTYDFEVVTYFVRIYSVDESCKDILRTINIETIKYNKYSEYDICNQSGIRSGLCGRYVEFVGEEDESKLLEAIEKDQKELNQTKTQKVLNIIKEYYLYVLIPLVLVGGYFMIKIIAEKRKQKK